MGHSTNGEVEGKRKGGWEEFRIGGETKRKGGILQRREGRKFKSPEQGGEF